MPTIQVNFLCGFKRERLGRQKQRRTRSTTLPLWTTALQLTTNEQTFSDDVVRKRGARQWTRSMQCIRRVTMRPQPVVTSMVRLAAVVARKTMVAGSSWPRRGSSHAHANEEIARPRGNTCAGHVPGQPARAHMRPASQPVRQPCQQGSRPAPPACQSQASPGQSQEARQSQTGTEPEPAVVSDSGAAGEISQNAPFPSAWRAPMYE